jgi:hypothetical protein
MSEADGLKLNQHLISNISFSMDWASFNDNIQCTLGSVKIKK